MANTVRGNRVNHRTERYGRTSYVDGNAVRKLQTAPQYEETIRRQRRRQISRKTARNRARALQMSRGYVVFLAVVCAATLFACVQYLQLKAEMTAQMKAVASLETQLSELKADNDVYYSEVLASVDLEKIRETAITKLGMNYATEEQVVQYSTKGNSYVRQYQDVPEVE
ncbi:MAG: hypothetical protein ACOYBL_02205 [Lachnospiraceae bacterium]|jgi:cell division protein FtsL